MCPCKLSFIYFLLGRKHTGILKVVTWGGCKFWFKWTDLFYHLILFSEIVLFPLVFFLPSFLSLFVKKLPSRFLFLSQIHIMLSKLSWKFIDLWMKLKLCHGIILLLFPGNTVLGRLVKLRALARSYQFSWCLIDPWSELILLLLIWKFFF